MRLPDNVITSLTSLVVLVTSSSSSSSSSLATTEDLASLLLGFAVVMLVAGGGGGGGVVMATSFNYTDLQQLGPGGSRRGGGVPGVFNVPGPRQLNREFLMARLGPDFDPARMSIDQPPTHSRSSSVGVPEFDPDLVEELGELDFSYRDERGETRAIPSSVRSVVERWLLQRASCQIRHTWKDMGALFWPRWIKEGHCDTNTPCSWPAGMHCVAATSDRLRLLHWQCRRSGDGSRRRVKRRSPDGEAVASSSSSSSSSGRRRPRRSQRQHQQHCRWKKVPFPVTSECFCSC